jgi:hypothetical protein
VETVKVKTRWTKMPTGKYIPIDLTENLYKCPVHGEITEIATTYLGPRCALPSKTGTYNCGRVLMIKRAAVEKTVFTPTGRRITEVVNGVKSSYCAGSKEAPESKRFKQGRGGYGRKYRCQHCGEYLTLGAKGTFNKHGRKKYVMLAVCAECGDGIYNELDYLCETCRG